MIGELSEDFVSINAPFFNENGTIVMVSEDDQNENPHLISYDINKYLADPSNYLAGEDDG